MKMKGKNRLRPDYQSFLSTDYCNVSACVRQNKELSQSCRCLLQHPLFCSWNTIRLHSSM